MGKETLMPELRHKAGIHKGIASAASDMGVKVLTLYVFSTENWSRPTMRSTFYAAAIAFNDFVPDLIKNNIEFLLLEMLMRYRQRLKMLLIEQLKRLPVVPAWFKLCNELWRTN